VWKIDLLSALGWLVVKQAAGCVLVAWSDGISSSSTLAPKCQQSSPFKAVLHVEHWFVGSDNTNGTTSWSVRFETICIVISLVDSGTAAWWISVLFQLSLSLSF